MVTSTNKLGLTQTINVNKNNKILIFSYRLYIRIKSITQKYNTKHGHPNISIKSLTEDPTNHSNTVRQFPQEQSVNTGVRISSWIIQQGQSHPIIVQADYCCTSWWEGPGSWCVLQQCLQPSSPAKLLTVVSSFKKHSLQLRGGDDLSYSAPQTDGQQKRPLHYWQTSPLISDVKSWAQLCTATM